MAIMLPEPIAPSPADRELADAAQRLLSRHVQSGHTLRISAPDGSSETVEIPAVAATLLMRLLRDLAAGHAVTLVPIHAILTTQEAADLLGVSRPFVIKLLEAGQIPHQMVGTHRRISFKDLMAYKKAADIARDKALDELVSEAQDLGLGY
jgi:excisionase family DNA binding protein